VLGLLFSLGKSFGVLIAIILELSFDSVGGVYLGWRAIISITAGFAVLQAILVFFFCPPTPYELV
jgi:predicted MFS family arabinose efflux permease